MIFLALLQNSLTNNFHLTELIYFLETNLKIFFDKKKKVFHSKAISVEKNTILNLFVLSPRL